MEIEKFLVRELTTQEQIMVNGGGKLGEIFADVWDGIKDFFSWVWNHVKISASVEIKDGFDISLSNK
ncbi:MAG: hypothetical protein ABSA76_15745 [Bacteroidales bacterium]